MSQDARTDLSSQGLERFIVLQRFVRPVHHAIRTATLAFQTRIVSGANMVLALWVRVLSQVGYHRKGRSAC